jgi:signal transduction histidine kinase
LLDARGRIQSPDSITQLSPRRKQRLQWLFLAWASVLVVLGTAGIVRVASNIGKTFGGFIWIYDPSRTPHFFAGPELWRSGPPSLTAIHLLDEIEAIDGISPHENDADFGQVYAQKQVGDEVRYEVRRGGQVLTIVEPVRLFTMDTFIVSHGLLYFTGLAFVGAGYTLLRFTERRDLALFAFVFLPAAGAWFFHGETASIHESFVSPAPIGWVLWTPALPLVGAILLHFAAIFPTPRGLVRRHPWLIYLGYGFAAVLMLGYATTLRDETFQISIIIIVSMGLFATLGIGAVLVSGALAYGEARRRHDTVQRRMVETLAVVGLIGAAIFSGFGIVPFLLLGYPLLPWEILLTLATLYPLALVYALRNAEMIAQLHQEITIKQQFSDKVNELQHIREQTLHEVADALHDRVIPDLRGLHFAAVAAGRRLAQPADPALAEDLRFIASTLNHLSDETRAIMEGAKPVDWGETGLGQVLTWLANNFQHANPKLHAVLETERYDESDPPAVKEALYLITRAALSNVQEHAQAKRVEIQLHSSGASGALRIADDGRGFDPAASLKAGAADRRHLGLSNMSLRAAEIGAGFEVSSQTGRGTAIAVTWERER